MYSRIIGREIIISFLIDVVCKVAIIEICVRRVKTTNERALQTITRTTYSCVSASQTSCVQNW
jgi:hypothetical protein